MAVEGKVGQPEINFRHSDDSRATFKQLTSGLFKAQVSDWGERLDWHQRQQSNRNLLMGAVVIDTALITIVFAYTCALFKKEHTKSGKIFALVYLVTRVSLFYSAGHFLFVQLGLQQLEGKKPKTREALNLRESLLNAAGWLFSGAHFYNHYRTTVIESNIKIFQDATKEVDQLFLRVDTVYHKFRVIMNQIALQIEGKRELKTISSAIQQLSFSESERAFLESHRDRISKCDAEEGVTGLFEKFCTEFGGDGGRVDVADIVLRKKDIEEVKANLLLIAEKNKEGLQNSVEFAARVGDAEFLSNFFDLGDKYIKLIDLGKLLKLAIREGKEGVVQTLLMDRIRNLCDFNGDEYTNLAVDYNNNNILKMLTDAGLTTKENGISDALKDGEIERARLLLKAQNDGKAHQTPEALQLDFVSAIKEGEEALVKDFLKAGTPYSQKCCEGGKTLLMFAVEGGKTAIALLLIEKYSRNECNEIDDIEETALFKAVKSGNEEVVNALLLDGDKGASPNKQCGEDKKTPLMLAIEKNEIAIALLLVKKSSRKERNEVDVSGETALFKAVKEGNKEVVENLLLGEGVSLDKSCGDDKNTPLILAIKENKIAIAEELIKNSTEIELNAVDKGDHAALYYAEQGEHKNLVEEIVKKLGSPAEIRPNDATTPLIRAITGERFLEAEALIGRYEKKDVDLSDQKGNKALDYLLECGSEACMLKFYEKFRVNLLVDEMVLILFWFMKRASDPCRESAAGNVLVNCQIEKNFLDVVQSSREDAVKGISEEKIIVYLEWAVATEKRNATKTWVNIVGISAIRQKEKLASWVCLAVQQGNADLVKFFLKAIKSDEKQIQEGRDLSDFSQDNIKSIRKSREDWNKRREENQWIFVKAHLEAIEEGDMDILNLVREFSGIQENKKGYDYVEEVVWLISRHSERVDREQSGCLPLIKQILTGLPTAMNQLSNDGLTVPMHANLVLEDGEILRLLECGNVDLHQQDYEGIPLLGHAVRQNKEGNVGVILARCQSDLRRSFDIAKNAEGVDPEINATFKALIGEYTPREEESSMESPLISAANAGNWDEVKLCLKKYQDSLRVALIIAKNLRNTLPKILQTIEKGLTQVDFAVKDDITSSLKWAVEAGSFRCVTRILNNLNVDHSAIKDVLKSSWESKNQAIFHCCLFRSNSQELYQDYLIKAAERGDLDLVRELVSSRDPEVNRISKKIALFCAWESGHKAVARYLSTSLGGDFGSKSRRRDFIKFAALFQLSGMLDITMMSLTNTNKRGDCIISAARYGNYELVEEMVRVWNLEKDKKTLTKGLEPAVLNNYGNIVDYLVRQGATVVKKRIEDALSLGYTEIAITLASGSESGNLENYLGARKDTTRGATKFPVSKNLKKRSDKEKEEKIEKTCTLRSALINCFQNELGFTIDSSSAT